MGNTVIDESGLEEKTQDLMSLINHEVNEGKVFVIVEGTDDEKFYGRFLDDKKVEFYVSESCYYVVKILEELNGKELFDNRLIGIKDADFDHLFVKTYPHLSNLFVTDKHDMELLSICDETIIALRLECRIHKDVPFITKAENDLLNLSFLRLYNQKIVDQGLEGINFDAIKIATIYDGENPVDLECCVNYIKSTCNNSRLPHYPSIEQVQVLKDTYKDVALDQITRGHDLVYALVERAKKISNTELGHKDISRILRVSCPYSFFKSTQLFQEINNWSESLGYRLWREAS